jgi:hypothetical protein
MPCQDYREALTEAAATGSAPSRELRSHFDVCESCRAAFSEELQLFAAIDTGLRAAVNSELPPSYLPRVRASLENDSASPGRWMPFLIFAAASAAIVLIVFIAARPGHRRSNELARQALPAPSRQKPETSAQSEAPGAPRVAASSRSYHAEARRNSAPANFASPAQPEVLVPPEEREAFARFIGSQPERNEVLVAVVAPAADNAAAILSVKPLEILELEVKPLEAVAGEDPDGAEEKQ